MLSNEDLDRLEQSHLLTANDHLGQDWQTCSQCAIRALIYELRNARSRLDERIRGANGCGLQGDSL